MTQPLKYLCWGMMAAALMSVWRARPADAAESPAPLLINRQPVDREEYLFFQQQERAGVIEQARTRCGLQPGPDFWDRRCAGTTPRALLQNKTLDRIIREKVEQLLFRDLGLVSNVDHAAFVADLETMNREREAAKARGRVLYGPVRFSELQYYGHWKARLQIQAKEQLLRDRLAISEDDLRASYRKDRKRYQTSPLSDWEIIFIQNTNLPAATAEKELAAQAKRIRARWKPELTGSQVLAAIGEPAGLSFKTGQLKKIDDERLAEYFSNGDLFDSLSRLKPGRVLVLPICDGTARVVKCVSRMPATPLPFDQARPQLQSRLLQQRYEALVKELAAKAEVRLNQAQIDLIPVD